MNRFIRLIQSGTFVGTDYSQQVLMTHVGEKFDAAVFSYLIVGGPEVVLVDTGYDADTSISLSYGQFPSGDPKEKLLAGLADAGLGPEDVQWVINTHLHFDHVANNDFFPKARFVVRRRELMEAAAPVYNAAYYRPYIARFVNDYWDRLVLIDEDCEFLPGIRLVWTGAHSVGHQAVYVQTSSGTVIIAGDVLNVYENLQTRSPNIINAHEGVRATERFKREGDIILPAHDPEVIRRHGYWIPGRPS
jgi:glyoxylase-like metal-dependent hydrolase (beta-lactamase superfamily II)